MCTKQTQDQSVYVLQHYIVMSTHQESQQDRGTEMLVSITEHRGTIPPCYKTEYLTPGTDIPSSPGHRAVRHVDRGREATTTTTG